MKRLVSIITMLVSLSLASVALAQEAPPKASGSMGFKSDPAPLPANATPLQRCERDVKDLVERIQVDDNGKPFLVAGYLAFFSILVAFSALAALKNRKLEAEMVELRLRLAKLIEGP